MRSTKHYSPVRTRASPSKKSPSKSTKRPKSAARHSPLRTTGSAFRESSPSRRTTFNQTFGSAARGGSPMRGYEEEELIDNLKELIDYERELENLKENLA